MTVADLKVQKTLEVCLNALYPTLRVEGEESKESIAELESAIDPSSITDEIKNYISSSFLNGQHDKRRDWIRSVLLKYYGEDEVSIEDFETFSTKDACVWIDPLDGTNDFVKGNLPAVTVLIGLSIKDKSRVGIVHNPFSVADREVGNTFFGTAEHGVFKIVSDKNFTTQQLITRELDIFEPFT